jgi:hydrogenase maturation protein HypF
MVRAIAAQYGALPVVLTGGCFQNDRLAERVVRELGDDFTVHLHERVPPGDGGIALGQAVVAGAIARRLGT